MKSREDAVRWFEARGYRASIRDWSFGPTVAVCTGASEGPDGITCYDRMIHIIQSENDRWIVADSLTRDDYPCDDLRQACEFSIRCLANREKDATGR